MLQAQSIRNQARYTRVGEIYSFVPRIGNGKSLVLVKLNNGSVVSGTLVETRVAYAIGDLVEVLPGVSATSAQDAASV